MGHVVAHLDEVNAKLADASPQQILEWAVDNLPHLYQTTAFGLTGCATLAMVSEISQRRAVAPVAAATTTTTTGNAPEVRGTRATQYRHICACGLVVY